MARQRIRLTESQLNRVIKESVKRVLKEDEYISPEDIDQYADFGVSGDEYSKLIDYDKGFRQRDNGKINPTMRSYMKYQDRIPSNVSDGWKNFDMNRDFERNTMGRPSPEEINDIIDNHEWYAGHDGRAFKNNFIYGRDNNVNRDMYRLEKERGKNKTQNFIDRKESAKAADKRPLHRKGSLNREL